MSITFFNFRLKKVKEKWDEIITLANENSIVLSDENVCGEFLAFLIEALPKSNLVLKLDKVDQNIVFLINGEEYVPALPFGKDKVDEEAVLFNLLQLAPKKVLVANKRSFSKEFLYITDRYF